MSRGNQPAPDTSVTLINVFEIPAEEIDEFIKHWHRRAHLMSTMPGCRDFQLHRAISTETRFQLVNIAHWDSREAWEAAMKKAGFGGTGRPANGEPPLQVTAYPALYQVVATYDNNQENHYESIASREESE